MTICLTLYEQYGCSPNRNVLILQPNSHRFPVCSGALRTETMQAPEILAQARAVMSGPNSRSTSFAQLSGNLAEGSYLRSSIHPTSGPLSIPPVAESEESAAGREEPLSLLEQARLVMRSPTHARLSFFSSPLPSLSVQESDVLAAGSSNWAQPSSRDFGGQERSSLSDQQNRVGEQRTSPRQVGTGLRMRVNSLSVVDFDEPSPMSGVFSVFERSAGFDSAGGGVVGSSVPELGSGGASGSLLDAARALVRGGVAHATASVSLLAAPSAAAAADTSCRAPMRPAMAAEADVSTLFELD